MRLSRFGYYGDFFVFPPVTLALAGGALAVAPERWLHSVGWFAFGFVAWTFLEYMLHRFVLHHVPFIREMHDAHHHDQKALIGTPTWLSLAMMTGIAFVPMWFFVGFAIAGAATSGLMLGYLWYVTMHHAAHHWRPEHDSYFYRERRRHAQHHYTDERGNFGVTSGFWDRVFGTVVGGIEDEAETGHV